MATTKKTKKTATKRFITKKEYDSIIDSYYRLKNKVYKMAESGKLNATAEKELRTFLRGLEKARSSASWAKASNYTAG